MSTNLTQVLIIKLAKTCNIGISVNYKKTEKKTTTSTGLNSEIHLFMGKIKVKQQYLIILKENSIKKKNRW